MTRVVLFAALLACATPALAEVKLQKPVPYAEDNDVQGNVKAECPLGEQLADYIKEYSTEPVAFTTTAPDTASGRVLQLEIVDAVSMGNAFMGHQKRTKIKGALYEDGRKVAAFKGIRNSMGGAFAGYKGSCSVLGRTIQALGRDVAAWLKAPVDGATIGE